MSSKADFGPTIEGIHLPKEIILPPEVITLLPYLGYAELKVTLAAIARFMRVGGAEPITLTEFEELTGLSHQAVLDGIALHYSLDYGIRCSSELVRRQEVLLFLDTPGTRPVSSRSIREVSVRPARSALWRRTHRQRHPLGAPIARRRPGQPGAGVQFR